MKRSMWSSLGPRMDGVVRRARRCRHARNAALPRRARRQTRSADPVRGRSVLSRSAEDAAARHGLASRPCARMAGRPGRLSGVVVARRRDRRRAERARCATTGCTRRTSRRRARSPPRSWALRDAVLVLRRVLPLTTLTASMGVDGARRVAVRHLPVRHVGAHRRRRGLLGGVVRAQPALRRRRLLRLRGGAVGQRPDRGRAADGRCSPPACSPWWRAPASVRRRLRETLRRLAGRAARLPTPVPTRLMAEAAAAERARIARELHDILGHGLGVVVLQTGPPTTRSTTTPTSHERRYERLATTAEQAIWPARDPGRRRARPDRSTAASPQPTIGDLAALAADSSTPASRSGARSPAPPTARRRRSRRRRFGSRRRGSPTRSSTRRHRCDVLSTAATDLRRDRRRGTGDRGRLAAVGDLAAWRRRADRQRSTTLGVRASPRDGCDGLEATGGRWRQRQLLATLDAHEVYRPLGYVELAHPERWMERDLRPDVPPRPQG